MKKELTIDEKYLVVQPYYERVYHIRFKERPSDLQINFLYVQMRKLAGSERVHLDKSKIPL